MPENSVFKDNLFEGKKVFITGGATGMGLGFAQAFLNHGAEVFIASRKLLWYNSSNIIANKR